MDLLGHRAVTPRERVATEAQRNREEATGTRRTVRATDIPSIISIEGASITLIALNSGSRFRPALLAETVAKAIGKGRTHVLPPRNRDPQALSLTTVGILAFNQGYILGRLLAAPGGATSRPPRSRKRDGSRPVLGSSNLSSRGSEEQGRPSLEGWCGRELLRSLGRSDRDRAHDACSGRHQDSDSLLPPMLSLLNLAMSLPLPDIPESECTPLVRQLLDIIQLQNRIQELEDEILRLKGLKTRPMIAPSPLEAPPRPPREPGQKRPGSAKRLKTAQLTITDEIVVPLPDPPPGSVFKGYEDFVVQDLVIRPQVIRYRRERWQTPDGQNLVAELPADVRPDSHFGPTLISFIIHQYHHQHVTQPLLWEQLDQLGIDISTGQLSRILTEGKDAFHQEKAELLPAGLAVSTYVQVDDTGARHQGHNGFCTPHRQRVVCLLREHRQQEPPEFPGGAPRCPYRLHDQRLCGGLLAEAEVASGGDRAVDGRCAGWADKAAWQAYLTEQQVTDQRHVRAQLFRSGGPT